MNADDESTSQLDGKQFAEPTPPITTGEKAMKNNAAARLGRSHPRTRAFGPADRVRLRGRRPANCPARRRSGASSTAPFTVPARSVSRTGDLYEGSFDLGRRAGAGTMRFADGRRYTGAWADDRPEGQGVFAYPNGDRYEGSYRRGMRHGRGVLTTHAGARYDGEWVSDREHGQGRRKWPDGRIYEGTFRDGRPHGAGTAHRRGVGVRVSLRAGNTRPERDR